MSEVPKEYPLMLLLNRKIIVSSLKQLFTETFLKRLTKVKDSPAVITKNSKCEERMKQ